MKILDLQELFPPFQAARQVRIDYGDLFEIFAVERIPRHAARTVHQPAIMEVKFQYDYHGARLRCGLPPQQVD